MLDTLSNDLLQLIALCGDEKHLLLMCQLGRRYLRVLTDPLFLQHNKQDLLYRRVRYLRVLCNIEHEYYLCSSKWTFDDNLDWYREKWQAVSLSEIFYIGKGYRLGIDFDGRIWDCYRAVETEEIFLDTRPWYYLSRMVPWLENKSTYRLHPFRARSFAVIDDVCFVLTHENILHRLSTTRHTIGFREGVNRFLIQGPNIHIHYLDGTIETKWIDKHGECRERFPRGSGELDVVVFDNFGYCLRINHELWLMDCMLACNVHKIGGNEHRLFYLTMDKRLYSHHTAKWHRRNKEDLLQHHHDDVTDMLYHRGAVYVAIDCKIRSITLETMHEEIIVRTHRPVLSLWTWDAHSDSAEEEFYLGYRLKE